MSKELKYNEPWILQRADPYVYRHTDGNYDDPYRSNLVSSLQIDCKNGSD